MRTSSFAISLLLSSLSVLLAAQPAHARPAEPLRDSAEACARSAQTQVGLSRFELVNVRQRAGHRNFYLWLNAHDANVGVACHIRRGDVHATHVQETHWPALRMRTPEHWDLAAR